MLLGLPSICLSVCLSATQRLRGPLLALNESSRSSRSSGSMSRIFLQGEAWSLVGGPGNLGGRVGPGAGPQRAGARFSSD